MERLADGEICIVSVEPDHKAMAISRRDGAGTPLPIEADAIVTALEKAAEGCASAAPSRKAYDIARRLHGELKGAVGERPDARALLLRGRAALRRMQEAYRANAEGQAADEAAVAAAPAAGAAERRAARAEAVRLRDEAHAGNAERMGRIVAALEAAARTEDPSRFTEQARLCKQIWNDIGSAGPEGPALRKAYRRATAAFWAKAGVAEPGGVAEPDEPGTT